MPAVTTDPGAGDCETVTLQPVVVTSPSRFGMTPSQFESTGTCLSVAQVVIVGALAGTTVTENEQFAPDVVDTHVTRVVPVWNEVPEAGLQVTVPQVPVVVGAA
jgi:hypothetical protein